MQSNLKVVLNAGLSSIGNFFRRNPDLVRKFVLGVVVIATLFFLVRYVNQFLYKSRAGTDDVSVSMLPSTTSVTAGDEFSIAVPLTTDPASADKKVSGADIQVQFDSIVDYVGFTQTPDPNYFNDVVKENVEGTGEAKLLRLVVVANKTDQALAKSAVINLKFKSRENVPGIAEFHINKAVSQIVGTATDNIYSLPSEEIATAVKIGLSAPNPSGTEPSGVPANGVVLSFNDVRLQGVIREAPSNLSQLAVKVTVKNLNGGNPMSTSTTFTSTPNATWSGKAVFPQLQAGTYSVFLKGRKHLQRKVCFASNQVPTSTPQPTNADGTSPEAETVEQDINCPNDRIYLQAGNSYTMTLDPKVRIQMYAGDLPIDDVQDGLIDSLDLTYLRNRLGQTNNDYINVGDLNLDNIIDTQDHSLPIAILNLGINEDQE